MEGLGGLFSCLHWSGFFPPFSILGVALGFMPNVFFVAFVGLVFGAVGALSCSPFFAGLKLFLPFRLLLPPAPITSPCAVTP